MTVPALLGIAVGLGVDVRRVALLYAAAAHPLPLAALIGVHVWRNRPRPSIRGAAFCEAVAGELRSGSPLRHALKQAAESVAAADLARAMVAAPLEDLAEATAAEFPDIGSELEACIMRSALSGGPAADLFDEIGTLALAQLEVRHEVRAAQAPAQATALVLLAVPFGVVWMFASGGRLGAYLATGPQRIAAIAGVSLVGLSLIVGVLMVKRSL